ncbi:MAG TPA: hypothetical protein VFU35_15065 [Jatrophihabitans sp.]|nr:hypothetical protein [Jatrophihabitans sp.]
MRHDTGASGVEFLDAGSTGPDDAVGDGPRSRSRWVAVLAVGTAVIALIAALTGQRDTQSAAPNPVRGSSSAPIASPAPPPLPTAAPVSVTDLGHPLLGVTAGWELFGRGDGVLVRVQFARGRITRTVVPGLQSTGPVSFVVADRRALIRPIDVVPGYTVAAGQPARPMSTRLADSGPMLPGPDPGHVWVAPDPERLMMALVGVDGSRTGTTIRLPPESSPLDAVADGAGYVLITSPRGVFDARPGALRRISTGSLLAVGPTGWLVAESDRRQREVLVHIDSRSGRRHVVGPAPPAGPPAGLIAPDGRTAVIFAADYDVTPYMLELTGAAERPVELPGLSVDVSDAATIAWSPDSRWLFAIDTIGAVRVIDVRSRQIRTLAAPLPPLRQLVVTSGPAR